MSIFKIHYFVTWLYTQKGEYWLIFPSTIQLNSIFFEIRVIWQYLIVFWKWEIKKNVS